MKEMFLYTGDDDGYDKQGKERPHDRSSSLMSINIAPVSMSEFPISTDADFI